MHHSSRFRPRRLLTLGSGALAAVTLVLPASAGTYTWKGGTGDWSDGANWVGGTAPSHNTDDILIDGGNPVTSDATYRNNIGGAGAVTIDTGDALHIPGGSLLGIGGPLAVDGLLDLSEDGGYATLRAPSYEAGPTTFSLGGTGRILLGGSWFYTVRSNDSIEIASGLLVQSVGPGVSSLQAGDSGEIRNAGTLQAGSDGVNTGGGFEIRSALRNTGTLRAASPGFLATYASATNDTGGVMEATGGGTLDFAGPFTNNGTLRAFARGELAFAADATNRGSIQVDPDSFLIMAGGNLHSPAGLDLPVGNLVGNGTVTADVRLGGAAAPGYGEGDVGSLTIAGNLTLTGGAHCVAELSGTGGADLLQIQGNLDLSATGDVLDLQDLGGLNAGDRFVIATYSGALTGTFDQVTPGYLVSYDTPGEIAVTVVPEPASMGGALAGAVLLCRRSRRKARQPQKR